MLDKPIGRVIKTLFLIGLAIFLVACPVGAPQPETPPAVASQTLTESIDRAFQLIADGKFKEARAELERSQTLAAGPCGECLLGMSHVYASEKNWKRSQEAARQALPLLPTPGLKARAYDQLGIAAFFSKNLDEAEDGFRRAVSSGGAWGTLARYNLAQVLLTRQRWAEAADKASSENESETVRIGGKVTRPEILFQPRPVYPKGARRVRQQGTVIVEANIDPEGCVNNVRPLKSLPHGLTESAEEAVRRWVFKPATLDGVPVKVYYAVTVNFQVQAPEVPLLLPGIIP
jgi:TonB family protein